MTDALTTIPITRRFRERDLTVAATLAALILVVQFGYSDSPVPPMVVGLLVSGASLVAVIRSQPTGFWSAPVLCLVVLCVFHFGAIPHYLLAGEAFTETLYDWMALPEGPNALWVSIAGVLAFTALAVGVSPARVVPLVAVRSGSRPLPLPGQFALGALPFVAAAAVVGGVAIWFGLTSVLGGLNPITSTYWNYLDVEAATPFTWVCQPIGLGFTFLALSRPGILYRVGLAAFAVFAVVAFFVGFRGEVLFPVVAHLALLAYRRRLPSPAWIVVVGLAGLSLVSLVQDVRLSSAADYSFRPSSISPLDGITELGFSQYVVERTYAWHADGEPFAWGATYAAPIERLVLRVVGADRVPGDSDPRLFNVLVKERELGSVGSSVIGEAYYNAGRLGVILVLGLWGALLGALSSRARSGLALAFLGIVTFAFLWNVRNAFPPIPLQVTAASLAVLATVVTRLPDRNRRSG